MAPVGMQHFAGAQKEYKPPLVANENAFLGDIFSSGLTRAASEKVNPSAPISCGFYRLEKGTPLVYTYSYDECKIIVEGSFTITDETGQKVKAVPGDVFFFPNGAKITFETDDYGLAFFTGQRKEGVL